MEGVIESRRSADVLFLNGTPPANLDALSEIVGVVCRSEFSTLSGLAAARAALTSARKGSASACRLPQPVQYLTRTCTLTTFRRWAGP